jgi:hypothetical protein
MALLHRATLRPSKLELLTAWLPNQPWYRADSDPVRISGFRFDDPDSEVGIETLLVKAGDGPLLQVPLTYRAAPFPAGEAWLLGTAEHSVLGRRWIYDACGDPVYAAALATAILTGGHEAEEVIATQDGRLERRDPGMSVTGGGTPGAEVPAVTAVVRVDDADPTTILTHTVELTVRRVLDGADGLDTGLPALTGYVERTTGTGAAGPGDDPLTPMSIRVPAGLADGGATVTPRRRFH